MSNYYNNLSGTEDRIRNDSKNTFGAFELSENSSNRTQPSGTMLNTSLNTQNRSRTPSPSRPLLTNPTAPIAHLETDDEIDTREVVNQPYPGVDDGFFHNGNNGVAGNPDVEFLPTNPTDPEETDRHFPVFPNITPRLGPDGETDKSGEPDAAKRPSADNPPPPNNQPAFPRSPGFRPWGYDFEVGNTLPSGETIPDLNVYQHKKTLAQGMMDLALFSANANQLRYVLETFRTHPYYYPSFVLIAISLMLQIGVGIGLIWNATYNVKDQKALCIANKINNFTIIGVFLVTVINVFISAFGVAPAPV